ncbi:unnamed protein product, partial [Linum tenue]
MLKLSFFKIFLVVLLTITSILSAPTAVHSAPTSVHSAPALFHSTPASVLAAPTSVSPSTVIGITYTSPLNSPPSSAIEGGSVLLPPPSSSSSIALPPALYPEAVASTVSRLRFGAVRLVNPHPNLIRAFSFTNASLFLSIPNGLLPPLASNRSLAIHWIRTHVLAFYPRSKIAVISVGDDVSRLDSELLMTALRKVYSALQEVGITRISVTCTFSFLDVVTTAIPPSAAAFKEPIGEALILPLLRFLESTNSSFSVSVQPYHMYRVHTQIPLGLALFQGGEHDFYDDFQTGLRYGNLFDMMADAVFTALAVAGHAKLPLIVAESGWPASGADSDANLAYAAAYVRSLVAHLSSGGATPMGKLATQAYLFELTDGTEGENLWGLLFTNLSRKYAFHVPEPISGSGSGRQSVSIQVLPAPADSIPVVRMIAVTILVGF